MIGEVVGNYRILSECGKGGMGVVYAAEHVQLGKPVAVKMLLPALASDPTIAQRFFNEARAASAIEHPNIVEIFDFGYHESSAYIVMALLRGHSLDHRLLHGALPPLQGASICAQVAAGLAAAHARGIVHRDLKPDNIFLVPNELLPDGVQVKLLDFGIAKLADERQAGFKTQTGALIGTPAYMSPEQCMGRSDLDHRTDLYSLGCILFHVLTGRPPFTSDHGTGVMIAAHMRDPAPHPRSIQPAIPDALAAITMRLLEKDPAARFQSAAEVRAALVQAGAHAPVTKPGAVDQYGATMVSMPSIPPPAATPIGGDLAYAATTVGGSAAQVMTQPAPRPRGRRALWIGLGVLALAGGAAAGVGLTLGRTSESSEVSSREDKPRTPAPPTVTVEPPRAAAAPARNKLAAPVACPDGQVRGPDTQGHCCWKDQAWSTAKDRCVGAPSCPQGTEAHDDDCRAAKPAEIVAERPPITRPGPVAPAPAARFRLASRSFAPGAPIAIAFPAPMASPPTRRYWICIAERGQPESAYGSWAYVGDGATTAKLAAPTKPGAYEVRLHGNYPKQSYHLEHAVGFTVAAPAAPASSDETPLAQQRFSLGSTQIAPGARAQIRFPIAMHAREGERFWITVVAIGANDSTWGTYEYVPDGARGMTLAVPNKPGAYEIRLHANYPTRTTHLVHRVPITVE